MVGLFFLTVFGAFRVAGPELAGQAMGGAWRVAASRPCAGPLTHPWRGAPACAVRCRLRLIPELGQGRLGRAVAGDLWRRGPPEGCLCIPGCRCRIPSHWMARAARGRRRAESVGKLAPALGHALEYSGRGKSCQYFLRHLGNETFRDLYGFFYDVLFISYNYYMNYIKKF